MTQLFFFSSINSILNTHLYPGADQVQRVGEDWGGAAGQDGGQALQRRVRHHATQVVTRLLLRFAGIGHSEWIGPGFGTY